MTTPSHKIVPLFDCLTHPSLDGSWMSHKGDGENQFEAVASQMKAASFKWAWAVAMGTQGPYDLQRFVKACEAQEVTFFPVAFLDLSTFKNPTQLEEWIAARKAQGYFGVKLHPRLGGFSFAHKLLPDAIKLANRYALIPLLCSYFYSASSVCQTLSVQSLRDVLHETIGEKLILLHSGATQLLDVSEMTRPFKSVMLDLSFTILEYEGSSLDADLNYVLNRCQDRVCIGSDSPEFKHAHLRSRFEQLTSGFTQEHKEKIAYRNVFKFANLPGCPA